MQDFYKEITSLANPKNAEALHKYFKTGKGEYGEGDIFLGLKVPQSRSLSRKYKNLPLMDIETLLQSKFHEYRQIGLMILVLQFAKADSVQKKSIVDMYLSHTKAINNWDLVDASAEILGEWLYETKGSMSLLKKLAHSQNIWERRIAMLATFAFIKHKEDNPTYEIASILITDQHDLMHKAVGWMLREAGKRVNLDNEKAFLKKHYQTMGRTTLRYAIEKFPEKERQQYLVGLI